MTVYDDVITALREFKRFTGDGLPNEPVGAPLPVGDPASGVWNPKKSDLRGAFGGLAQELLDGIAYIDGMIPAIEAARDEALGDIDASKDEFYARYLGAHANDPATDNEGNPLIDGALYWNTTTKVFRAYDAATGTWNSTRYSFAGPWNDADTFSADSLVEHGGSIWLALRDNTNVEPTEGADWTLFLPGVTVADGSVGVAKLEPTLNAHLRRSFDTVADLLADTIMAYGTGPLRVSEGNNIEAQGFRYEVAASDATDAHVETAGGVKLKVIMDDRTNVLAFGAVGDNETDDVGAFEKMRSVSTIVRVASGYRYRFKRTWECGTLTHVVSDIPQFSSNNETIIYGTIGDLGDDGALIRVVPAGGNAQSVVFENIRFAGDLAVDPANLPATSSQGIIGVDPSGVKNGIDFIGCAFRGLKHPVKQVTALPYMDKVVFTRCRFARNGGPIYGLPTAGWSFVDCDWDDNVALVVSPALNEDNSITDYGYVYMWSPRIGSGVGDVTENCIRAPVIIIDGGYIEGPANLIQPYKYAKATGLRYAAVNSDPSGRFIFRPMKDDVTLEWHGGLIPDATRLVNFGLVTDRSTIWMDIVGAHRSSNSTGLAGAGFSDASDIAAYIPSINYRGFGNTNGPTWNYDGKKRDRLTANYTLVRGDDMKEFVLAAAGMSLTIPANASVPFPIGATIEITNETGSTDTINIDTDTLRSVHGTGTRSLAGNGWCQIKKISTTTWQITGDIS